MLLTGKALLRESGVVPGGFGLNKFDEGDCAAHEGADSHETNLEGSIVNGSRELEEVMTFGRARGSRGRICRGHE